MLLENPRPNEQEALPSEAETTSTAHPEIPDDVFMQLVSSNTPTIEFYHSLLHGETTDTVHSVRPGEISHGIFSTFQNFPPPANLQRFATNQVGPYQSPVPASFSPMSTYHSPASYMDADTPASFMSAVSTFNSPACMNEAMTPGDGGLLGAIEETPAEDQFMVNPRPSLPPLPPSTAYNSGPLVRISKEYHSHLEKRGLLPEPEFEINWSGKGQHVEFLPGEEVPLQILGHLGSSLSATVDKVKCRRIDLARKTMRCTHDWKAADALREVEHLHKLRHCHIVQLIGSYLQGRAFSILMYPAADYDLGTFLDKTVDLIRLFPPLGSDECIGQIKFLESTFSCLSSAVAFIHLNTTRHMDMVSH